MTQEDQQEALKASALKAIHSSDWRYLKDLHLYNAKEKKLRYDCYIEAGWDASMALYFIMNGN